MTERLTALDASFLYLESPRTPMHVGSLSMFEGEPLRDSNGRLRLEELRTVVEERLPLVPRFRRRIFTPPLRLGLPLWVDDDAFDVRHHVRAITLPAPGTPAQLRALAAELHMDLLDRSRPLWEMWFVDGLADGNVALVEKLHHCLVDGVSGVDVATATMDLTRDAEPREMPQLVAEPAPSLPSSIRDAAADRAWRLASGTARRMRHPSTVVDATRRTQRGLTANPAGLLAPRSSLNQSIGKRRVLESVTLSLDAVKAVGRRADTKANDVFLAIVAGALRRLLLERGEPADARLRVLAPMSLRTDGEVLGLGNRVSGLVVPLPVDLTDPWERLITIRDTTRHLRERDQASVSASALDGLNAVPPLLWSMFPALVQRQPLVNLVVTNVAGSPVPLYLLGAQLLESIPIVPLSANLTVSVGILSYQRDVVFGLFADEAACPDVDVFAEAIEKSFVELQGVVS